MAYTTFIKQDPQFMDHMGSIVQTFFMGSLIPTPTWQKVMSGVLFWLSEQTPAYSVNYDPSTSMYSGALNASLMRILNGKFLSVLNELEQDYLKAVALKTGLNQSDIRQALGRLRSYSKGNSHYQSWNPSTGSMQTIPKLEIGASLSNVQNDEQLLENLKENDAELFRILQDSQNIIPKWDKFFEVFKPICVFIWSV